MRPNQLNYQDALENFRKARQQAALQEVLARLTGKSNTLLSYEDVARKLKLKARTERGVQTIPVNAIVGSTDRYTDFTRDFMPRQDNDQERWARVKATFSGPEAQAMPPIDVYQVGDVYFVQDGNHRVSIARQEGRTFIEAHVIEVHTDIPLTPDVKPDDLIVKAEYADFLQATGLADLRPNVNLSVTVPGQYKKLEEQIECHQYCNEDEQQCQLSRQDAIVDWYDNVYTVVAEAIRDRGLLRWFPGRTETDLYLWVSEHRTDLEQELGWAIRPEAAVAELVVTEGTRAENFEAAPGSWRKARLFDRYTDRLFVDILVPLSGTPKSWHALDQAILIAQREQAHVHGLHIVASESQKKSEEALAIQTRFNEQCAAANVAGNLAIESGDITRKICERALLADLVVLNVAHPPAVGLPSLGSGLRTIIWRLARPLLALPGDPSHLHRALLAFDGSPKAKEALFVATYLAEQWKTALTVITLTDDTKVSSSVPDYARDYLELHEIQADFISANGPIDVFLKIIEERNIDLVLMGGYSASPLEEVMIGSAVNFMLRETRCPLLICR